MQSRWSEVKAADYVKRCDPRWGTDLALGAYSTLLLQNEQSLTWQGRGNVSVKGTYSNVFHESVPAIFVMDCGGGIVTAEYTEPITLDLTYLRRLRCLSVLPDDQMFNELRTHLFDFREALPPVETLVHSFLPMKYIAHVHAGALSAVADRVDGREVTRRVLGDRIIVLPYCKPGFELAKTTVEAYEDLPEARGVIWKHHGVLTWGETASAAYDAVIELVAEAEKWLDRQSQVPVQVAMHSPPELVRERVLRVAPVLRGLLGQALRAPEERLSRMIIQPVNDAAILELLASSRGKDLALGPPLTCHYLKHTKPAPMWLDVT